MIEPMEKRNSRQRSTSIENFNNNNKTDLTTITTTNSDSSIPLLDTNPSMTTTTNTTTTADDDQILAILAHMSQQQSIVVPSTSQTSPPIAQPDAFPSAALISSRQASPAVKTKLSKARKSSSPATSNSKTTPSTLHPIILPSAAFISQEATTSTSHPTEITPIASTSTFTSSLPPLPASMTSSNTDANTKASKASTASSLKGKGKGKSKAVENDSESQLDQLANDDYYQATPVGSGDERSGSVGASSNNVGIVSGKGGKGKEEDFSRTRKDNHKEVERRRRETINDGINDLKLIVPGCEKNKGSILSSAVQYIQQLKDSEASNIEKWTLEKLLSDQVMEETLTRCEAYRLNGETLELELEEKNKECIALREELERLKGSTTSDQNNNGVSGKRALEQETPDEEGKRRKVELNREVDN